MDIVNAGSGRNVIHVNSFGSTVIVSGNGEDTLDIHPQAPFFTSYKGNDLLIKSLMGDEIRLKDYKLGNHSVKWVTIDGLGQQSIGEFLSQIAGWKSTTSSVNVTPMETTSVNEEINLVPTVGNDILNLIV